MTIGCVSLIPVKDDLFIGLKCNKGRGFILPGGKWEDKETLKEGAARELLEETGLVMTRSQLLFQAHIYHNTNNFYSYTFLTEVKDYDVRMDGPEGDVRLITWEQMFQSVFGGYYRMLKDAYDTVLALAPNLRKKETIG